VKRFEEGDWDLTSIGLVLIGSSITVAGMIIAALLLGVYLPMAPFLLLTTAFLIVMSAVIIVYYDAKHEPNPDWPKT
jgi:membrane protein implicated in regulation of membrane protease activity